MNKYIASLFIGTSIIAGFTSCEDYLDREPEANLVAENYFTDGANLSAYVMRFYDGMLPSHSSNAYGMGTVANDQGTANQVAPPLPPPTPPLPEAPLDLRLYNATDHWIWEAHSLKHVACILGTRGITCTDILETYTGAYIATTDHILCVLLV